MRLAHWLLVPLFFLVSGCMTWAPNPGAYRSSKPKAIGVVGMMYHPSKKSGLGFTTDAPSFKPTYIRQGAKGSAASSIVGRFAGDVDMRELNTRKIDLDFFAIRYPFDKSGFYFGTAVTASFNRYAYLERTSEFGLNQSTTVVEWEEKAIELSFPIGLTRYTTDNVMFHSGIGPMWRIKRYRNFLDDGASNNVDVTLRDATLAALDEKHKGLDYQLLYMIGVSF